MNRDNFPIYFPALTPQHAFSILPRMPSALQQRILQSLETAMRPIARCLLRSGIGYREFADVCKAAFVNVASKDYGIRGRPTNISRIAVMTGLTRKEVRRIRDFESGQTKQLTERRSPPAEVLHSWYTDKRFVAPDGRPRILPFEGQEISFTNLVRFAAGDIPPGAMRTELKRIGAIIESDGCNLEACRRDFVPSNVDERLIEGIEFGIRTLASTIAFNSSQENSANPRFQRTVNSRLIPNSAVPAVQDTVHTHLTRLSENLDNYFAEVEQTNFCKENADIGVGLYFYIDDCENK